MKLSWILINISFKDIFEIVLLERYHQKIVLGDTGKNVITLVLLVTNLAVTKLCKKT